MKNVSLTPIISQLGAIITVPIIVLVPLAVVLDRSFGTMPFMTLGALVVSACISTIFVIRLISK